MKTYVLMVSTSFPATHKLRAGEPTEFVQKIKDKIKIHTIRENYALWSARIDDVMMWEAELSVRVWSGKPYRSKQVEVLRLTANEVNIEVLQLREIEGEKIAFIGNQQVDLEAIAKNDGLSMEDFNEWFKGMKLGHDYAIIHFSGNRYFPKSIISRYFDYVKQWEKAMESIFSKQISQLKKQKS